MGRQRLTQRYYWKGAYKDTELFISRCDPCQRHASLRKDKLPLHLMKVKDTPLVQIGMDLVGPLQEPKRSLFYEDEGGLCFLADEAVTDRHQLSHRGGIKYYGKVTAIRNADEACGVKGFVYHSLGNFCYLDRTASRNTWHMACKECRADGGTLMKVDTEEKHKFMVTYGESAPLPLWIGGKGKINWIWFDGTPIVKFYWQKSGKDIWLANCCLCYRWTDGQYRWDDSNCKEHLGFFCEVPVKR